MTRRRLATIDIGTNSVLLLAAEENEHGQILPLSERLEITRLGRGVDRTGTLSPEALSETLRAIESFAKEARALGCEGPYATATSAARDAANGHLLVEGAARFGVTVEIIAGEREARLSYRAVAGEFAAGNERLAVVDIGGGSTEVILGCGPRMLWRHSYDVGSVRLTERHLHHDPPTADELGLLKRAIGETLASLPWPDAPAQVVGIAGTFTTLATVELALDTWDASKVHAHPMSLSSLENLAKRLASLPVKARNKLPGLPEKRADVIVAGAFIACAVLDALDASAITVTDRGIRWGYLYEKLGR